MLSKVTLLATALALCLPAFADKPSKPNQTIAKPPASKNAPKGGSKNAPSRSSTTLAPSGYTPNGDLIAGATMSMWKGAKTNSADQKKQAQAAGGSTRKADKVRGNLTVIPPKK